jgi:ABC-2 type transport system permease protein
VTGPLSAARPARASRARASPARASRARASRARASRARASRARASRGAIVLAIVRKDLVEFSRDRLWMILTPLALVMFAVIFWLLPATVEETIPVGISPASVALLFDRLAATGEGSGEGMRFVPFESDEALAAAVAGRERVATPRGEVRVLVGMSFPEGFALRLAAGAPTTVRVYLDAEVPPELRGAMTSAVRELAFTLAGATVPVTLPATDEIVLGVDRAGAQIPLRERMRPMLAFFVLLTESLALASLLASEVGSRTITALLVTPARTSDIVIAKGVTGTLLAFGQALVLLVVTRSLGVNPGVVLAAVLLGAVLMAGVALLAGAAGRDFMTTLFIGVLLLLPLMIPAFSLLFPGTASPWVQAMPSYGIVQALVGATAYGQGFAELAGHFATGATWAALAFVLGGLALARKVATL